jgi:hypothetical protein
MPQMQKCHHAARRSVQAVPHWRSNLPCNAENFCLAMVLFGIFQCSLQLAWISAKVASQVKKGGGKMKRTTR